MDTSNRVFCLCATLLGMAALAGCSNGQAEGSGGFMEGFFPPSPSEVARDAFNVYDADQRRKAINLLSNAPWGGEEPYLKTYRTMLEPQYRDDDPTVRAAALRALGRHGATQDVRLVTPYLDPKEPEYVRVEAAVALQRLHHADAIEPLVTAVRDDEDSDVRLAVASALAQYPDPRVFQVLVGAINDEDYAVVTQAVESLELLTGKDYGEDGARWLAWAENTKDLFADQRVYYYPQFVKPRGTLDKVQFWKDEDQAKPQQPKGLDDRGGGEPTSSHRGDEPADALAIPGVPVGERPVGAAAMLLDAKDARWGKSEQPVEVGGALGSGFLTLESGRAVVEFGRGVKAAFYGPAEFSPHSDTHAYLRRGKALVGLPSHGEGFSVSGPGMTVVSQTGGQLGLVVHGDGTAEVYVFEGNAHLSVITADTGILKMIPVGSGHVAKVAATGAVRLADADSQAFDRAKPAPVTSKVARPLGTPDHLRSRVASQLRTTERAAPTDRQPDDAGDRPPHPLGASDAP